MVYHLDLLAILLAPVLSYLAAALCFSWLSKDKEPPSLNLDASIAHYRSGHK